MHVVHILAAYIRLASIPWFPLKHLISSTRNIQQELFLAIGGLHQTVLQSKTDAMRSERTKLIQL